MCIIPLVSSCSWDTYFYVINDSSLPLELSLKLEMKNDNGVDCKSILPLLSPKVFNVADVQGNCEMDELRGGSCKKIFADPAQNSLNRNLDNCEIRIVLKPGTGALVGWSSSARYQSMWVKTDSKKSELPRELFRVEQLRAKSGKELDVYKAEEIPKLFQPESRRVHIWRFK